MKIIFLFAMIFLGLLLIASSSVLRRRFPSIDYSDYKKKNLLTENEKEFFGRLVQAFPDYHVFSQVAFGALLQPTVDYGGRDYYRIRGTFSQKIADFVVCDQSLFVLAIIELDDRTHNAEKDAKRDAMLNQAGYKVVRWQSKNKPDVAAIRKAIILD